MKRLLLSLVLLAACGGTSTPAPSGESGGENASDPGDRGVPDAWRSCAAASECLVLQGVCGPDSVRVEYAGQAEERFAQLRAVSLCAAGAAAPEPPRAACVEGRCAIAP